MAPDSMEENGEEEGAGGEKEEEEDGEGNSVDSEEDDHWLQLCPFVHHAYTVTVVALYIEDNIINIFHEESCSSNESFPIECFIIIL